MHVILTTKIPDKTPSRLSILGVNQRWGAVASAQAWGMRGCVEHEREREGQRPETGRWKQPREQSHIELDMCCGLNANVSETPAEDRRYSAPANGPPSSFVLNNG
jgi:hypothetical protein